MRTRSIQAHNIDLNPRIGSLLKNSNYRPGKGTNRKSFHGHLSGGISLVVKDAYSKIPCWSIYFTKMHYLMTEVEGPKRSLTFGFRAFLELVCFLFLFLILSIFIVHLLKDLNVLLRATQFL